jgi:hypothetical protein
MKPKDVILLVPAGISVRSRLQSQCYLPRCAYKVLALPTLWQLADKVFVGNNVNSPIRTSAVVLLQHFATLPFLAS